MKRIIRSAIALVIGLGLGVAALAGLETVTHISDLNASWPLGSDLASTSDDHIRNIKTALKTDFPNISGVAPISSGSTVPANGIYIPSTNTLGFASNTTARGSVNSAGNWIISAPTSGTALSVTGANNPVQLLNFTSGSGGYITLQSSGVDKGYFGAGAAIGGSAGANTIALRSESDLQLLAGGSATRVTIASTGNITAAAPSSGEAFSVTAAANGDAISATAPNTTSQSFGIQIKAGTNSTDYVLNAVNAANTSTYFRVRGDGAILGLGGVAGALVDMTPDKSTFTVTYTGMTAGTTGTASWVRNGNQVTLSLPVLTGTSNSTSFTATGLPASIQPASLTQLFQFPNFFESNGAASSGTITVTAASGTLTFGVPTNLTNSTTGWAAAGTKGTAQTITFTYSLQ